MAKAKRKKCLHCRILDVINREYADHVQPHDVAGMVTQVLAYIIVCHVDREHRLQQVQLTAKRLEGLVAHAENHGWDEVMQ
jgi:hypothetical protein